MTTPDFRKMAEAALFPYGTTVPMAMRQAFIDVYLKGVNAGLEAAAARVPVNWLDELMQPLLGGKPITPKDVEALCLRIAESIHSLIVPAP